MLAGAHGRRHRRPVEPVDPARVLSPGAPLRGISIPRLGITRHLLADRLKKFVRYGVLRRARYQESPARYEYILTQRGLDLYPVVMSIVHWGDTHMVDERGRPLLHQHDNCGKLFDPVMVCSECGEPLHAKQVHTHPGPGAASSAINTDGGKVRL